MLADSTADAAEDATTMVTTLNNQEMVAPTKGYHCILYYICVLYTAFCILYINIQHTVYLLYK
jgi:hypothetical protein